MKIINYVGGKKGAFEILQKSGWQKKFHTFYMQLRRGRLSKEVSLILWQYCLQNNIAVKPSDFYDFKKGG